MLRRDPSLEAMQWRSDSRLRGARGEPVARFVPCAWSKCRLTAAGARAAAGGRVACGGITSQCGSAVSLDTGLPRRITFAVRMMMTGTLTGGHVRSMKRLVPLMILIVAACDDPFAAR